MTAGVWGAVCWGVIAALCYGWMIYAVSVAPKPEPEEWQPYPDWFWGGDLNEGHWVRYDEDAALTHAEYVGVKPEQTGQPESKPTSGAG